jgi:hypothetical protein
MKFYTSREKALESLDIFINKDIVNYSSKRNYDFGPIEKRADLPIAFSKLR